MKNISKDNLVICLHEILSILKLLTTKTQMYHWNIRSNNFYAYHKMFQEQYEELFKTQDIVAELIRTLGFFVNFNKLIFDLHSQIELMNEKDQTKMIMNLINDYKYLEKCLKEAIKLSQECEEEGVANELSEILSLTQKTIWFLKSHCLKNS